jgi:alcohol dehydrogenase
MRNCVTVRGQWMYPREASLRLIAMIRAGLLKLEMFATTVFDLDDIDKAIAYAGADRGPFKATVVQPQR